MHDADKAMLAQWVFTIMTNIRLIIICLPETGRSFWLSTKAIAIRYTGWPKDEINYSQQASPASSLLGSTALSALMQVASSQPLPEKRRIFACGDHSTSGIFSLAPETHLTNDHPRYTPVYIQWLLRVISTDKFHFGAVFLPNRSRLPPRPVSLVRSRDM